MKLQAKKQRRDCRRIDSPQAGETLCSKTAFRTTGNYCGGFPLVSGGLGGGSAVLSSLKIPAILPKKPFFFLGSVSADCPEATAPGWPAAGGGKGLSLPKPKILEKKPLGPLPCSQVVEGSVPTTKAAL